MTPYWEIRLLLLAKSIIIAILFTVTWRILDLLSGDTSPYFQMFLGCAVGAWIMGHSHLED